jgi:hypothetical protein
LRINILFKPPRAHAGDGSTGGEKTMPPVSFPSHTGAESYLIQALLAPVMLCATDAKAVGQD